MTIGEKIKHIRKQLGLSQAQFAQQIHISRSAIAKWENNNGLPDIDNIKMIAQTFSISLDSLIGDEQSVWKEKIDLTKYEGRKKVKKDQIMKERFPNAQIYTLLAQQKLTKSEKIIDNALRFLTTAPFGIPDFINGMKNLDKEFYLVEDDKNYVVMLTDDYLEIRQLKEKITEQKFEYDHWQFQKCPTIKK